MPESIAEVKSVMGPFKTSRVVGSLCLATSALQCNQNQGFRSGELETGKNTMKHGVSSREIEQNNTTEQKTLLDHIMSKYFVLYM